MARRNYKKTKRKLSRKVIHKTRRRTKNRVKKLSKNQSGGVITVSTDVMHEINEEIVKKRGRASSSSEAAAAPASSAAKKRGRASSSSESAAAPSSSAAKKRGRASSSSEAAAAPEKRAKPLLSDEELGKLVINSLFKKTTDVSFIQDNSRCGFILYGTLPKGVLFDTKNLPLREALDIDNIDKGIPLQHFCMKLSLVIDVPDADRSENYEYVGFKKDTYCKRAVSVIRSTKEAHLQKKLYDSFSCISGTSAFVPDVIAHGIFNREKLEHYISLFMSNRLGAATQHEIQLGTGAGIDDNVLHVLRELNSWLQQKIIEDTRKKDVTEKQNWAVDILLMEYIDTKLYETLYTLGTTTSILGTKSFDVSKIQKALLTTAAQLACATGVGIILYDCHPNNALSNASQSDVRLIDIGGAIDLKNEDDERYTVNIFDTMLDNIRYGKNTFCTIQQLCDFFDVIIAHTIVKKQTKQPKKAHYEEILTQKFQENLGTLVDFRCRQFTLEDIHHNLIMTAFVDFMMFIVVYGKDICQSRYTMERVYGAGTFSNFSAFLTQFRPNHRTFRSSVTPPLKSYDDNLSKVGTEISKIVTLCSSVECPINPEHLRLHYMLGQLSSAPPPPPSGPLSAPQTKKQPVKRKKSESEPSLSAPPPSAPQTETQPEQKGNQRGCTVM